MNCKACEIERDLGTAEVPHPVDVRLHTCVDAADPKTRRRAAAMALRAALALLGDEDEEEVRLAKHEVPDGEAFNVEVVARKTPRGRWAVQYGTSKRGDPLAVAGGLSGEHPTLVGALARVFNDVTRQISNRLDPQVAAPPWVVVNGLRKDDVPYFLAYAGVCKLAGKEPSTFPTVTYHYPDGRSGSLTPGDARVTVEVGMRFTVIHTGNA